MPEEKKEFTENNVQEKRDDVKVVAENNAAAVERLKKERDEYLEGWKRAKADFINYKKDEAQRMEQFVKYSTESIIADLLTVLDSFDLGLSVMKDDDPAKKGVLLIKSQLEDVLRRYGLEMIAIQKGEPFNPAIHEAVETIDSDAPPGSIIEEISHGYKLYGKVIRPARVKVSRSK